MPNPARTPQEIRAICRPQPLRVEELDSLFVETDEARDPDCSIRASLKSILGCKETIQRILVHGHRGSGKSTELTCLSHELGAGWWIVSFSIQDELPPLGVQAEDILLTIASRIVSQGKDESFSVDQKLIEEVHSFFREIKIENETERKSEIGVGVEAEAGYNLLSLFKLLGRFSAEMKFGSSRKTVALEAVRRRPADLVAAVNALIFAVQKALEPSGRQLLIIVEDLDKVTIADARKIFIESGQILGGLRCKIIYTIPIFTFLSPDASAMKAAFDHDCGFQMLKVLNADRTRAPGFEVVRRIIFKRVEKAAIDPDAIDLLIEKTGGVLRHVFEVLQTVASMTSLRELPIKKPQIEYGLRRLKASFGQQISLPDVPITGLNDVVQLYDKLADFENRRRQGAKCPPTGDAIVQVLLKSCALVEYNGERWLGVHPLVVEYLEDIGKL